MQWHKRQSTCAGVAFFLFCGFLAHAAALPSVQALAAARRLMQGDSIECSSWGPSQCNRPGVPDKCPRMCSGSGSGGGNCNGNGACSGNQSGNQSGNCFPANATVVLASGEIKRMDQLTTGDQVAVRRTDGKVGFEPIYAWGHRHAGTSSAIHLRLQPQGATHPAPPFAELVLTGTHFVMVAASNSAPLHKRARDVVAGDQMWVSAGNDHTTGLVQHTVVSVGCTTMDGLYNPYTLGGSIIVNGVVASSHSWWFADAAFDAWGLPLQWLPALYGAVLLPVRVLHHLMGTQAYAQLYDRLDASMDFAQLLSSGAGLLAVVVRLVGVVVWAYAQAVGKVAWRALVNPATPAALALAGAALVAHRKHASHAAGKAKVY